jgi:hypothetical protein
MKICTSNMVAGEVEGLIFICTLENFSIFMYLCGKFIKNVSLEIQTYIIFQNLGRK